MALTYEQIYYWFIGAVIGAFLGKKIGWAIRAWPGHESFHCDYLACSSCVNGYKRGCYNSGSLQDKIYILFSMTVFAFSVAYWGFSTMALVSWFFAVACLIVAVVDIRYLIIPDVLSINSIYAGVVYSVFCSIWVYYGYQQPAYYVSLKDSFYGLLLGGGSLWLLGQLSIIILKKEGMGGGDVKLLAAFGAWSNWQVVLGTILTASLLGSIGGLISIIYQKIKYKKKYKFLGHMIPFGPYLCVAFLFIFYFGLEPLLAIMRAYQDWVMGGL